jgi:class 3 adenylate cyclase
MLVGLEVGMATFESGGFDRDAYDRPIWPASTYIINPAVGVTSGALSWTSIVPAAGAARIPFASYADSTLVAQIAVEEEIVALKRQLAERIADLKETKAKSQEYKSKIVEFEKLQTELQRKERFGSILHKVNEKAREKLLASEEFALQFSSNKSCKAAVLSIDIRNSTGLMLKAASPAAFAQFVTTLCMNLMSIIIANLGVFDKFTGDGILAYFPEFYSGPDALYRAMESSIAANKEFEKHYKDSRDLFLAVPSESGLGIGIDYGDVSIVNVANDTTIVGVPVVYACRMADADAGTILINQPAQMVAVQRYSDVIRLEEATVESKEKLLGYRLTSLRKKTIQSPDWMND